MKIKEFVKSKKFTVILVIAILVVVSILFSFKKEEEKTSNKELVKKVAVSVVETFDKKTEPIKIVGKVTPLNSVDVVAMSNGTIKGLYFEIGDNVSQNQNLAFLSNGMTSTNLNTAQTSYLNMLSNMEMIERSANEQIRQSEIAVFNASESVNLAKISLASSEDNYKNNASLQEQGNDNIKENAIIAYEDNLNFVYNILNEVNYIIQAEDGEQLPGIAASLAVKNSQTLIKARDSYRLLKSEYLKFKAVKPNTSNVDVHTNKIFSLFSLVKTVVNDTVLVLENTVDTPSFSESALMAQKSKYNGLLASVGGMQTKIQASINGFKGIGLNDEKLLNSLKSAIDSAESQLEMAKASYDNSLVNLERAKQGKEQQLLSAQMSIDNAMGQLNVNREQFSDLTLKAPIKGKITKKLVDIGTEVVPGQTVAQVSQTDELKIEINLSSEDIYSVRVGQKVFINNKFEAEIYSISPVADSITRKVKAEIKFDNKNNDLISGTAVDIVIPAEIENDSGEDVLENQIFIPLKSISITQIENSVFVLKEGVAKKAEVKIGKQKGNFVEILSGISEGDLLIVEGNKTLRDGDRVEIQ